MQEISSKDTCIKTFPRLFKMVTVFPELFAAGNINLDYGGGKYDLITDYLKDDFDVTNKVFDPYNRDNNSNAEIQYQLTCVSGADSCTMSNVLNVIKGKEFRKRALVNAKHMMKRNSKIYITVHDGDRSGNGRKTLKGWQENRSTANFLSEVQVVFPNAYIKNNVIVGEKA